jgi:hypothetical protein
MRSTIDMSNVQIVIHNRRFWERYPDGRMKPIHMSARVRGQLHQTRAMEARDENKAANG